MNITDNVHHFLPFPHVSPFLILVSFGLHVVTTLTFLSNVTYFHSFPPIERKVSSFSFLFFFILDHLLSMKKGKVLVISRLYRYFPYVKFSFWMTVLASV